MPCARRADSAPPPPSRRTGTARRSRRARRRARSSFRRRPTSHRAGRAGPATTSASGAELHGPTLEVGDEARASAGERQPPPVRLDLQLLWKLAPQAQQLAGERVGLARLDPRGLERRERLRVGHVLARERRELCELPPPPLARRVGDERVDVVGEEL